MPNKQEIIENSQIAIHIERKVRIKERSKGKVVREHGLSLSSVRKLLWKLLDGQNLSPQFENEAIRVNMYRYRAKAREAKSLNKSCLKSQEP